MNAFPILALLVASLPAVASSGSTVAGRALTARTSIDFRIVVPRMLELRLLDQPATVAVTALDVENGEMVLTGPRVALLANDRRGYWIAAALRGPFTEATIEGLRAPLHVGAAGGRALMPSMVGERRPAPLRLRLRLRLKQGTVPGTYGWPVALSIQAP